MSTQTRPADVVVDSSREEIDADAFGFLARLRRETPVAYVPSYNAWIISRWDDLHEVIKQPENFRSKPTYLYRPAVGGEFVSTVGDGEVHQCMRRGLDGALAPRVIAQWAEQVVDPAIHAQLDVVASRGRGELLKDVIGPASFHMLAHAIGIPGTPLDVMERWYKGIAAGFFNFTADPAQQDRSWALSDEIDETFRPLMREKYDEPDDSMMAHLLKHAQGESFGEKLAFSMPSLKAVIFAGSQEPAHGAINTLIGILDDEQTRERYAASPYELAEQAGEEGLRWNPPLVSFLRRVLQTTTVGGVELPAGDEMLVSVGSADRDEAIWGPDADRFDLDRFARGNGGPRHIAFGMHPHFCAGNALARTMIRRSLPIVVSRLPNLRIDPQNAPRIGRSLLINDPVLHCVWDPVA